MYPSRNQYKEAVKNRMYPNEENGGYIFDPIYKNDELIISSGGNAIVFKVKDDKGEYALKLFSGEVDGRFNRLKVISSYLDNNNDVFFTKFSFIEKLIYVEISGLPDDKCFFPGVIMKWIEADDLESKLKLLVQQKKRKDINKIAENFKKIAVTLLNEGVAHGDLKLSNMMVDEKLNIYLIDYDGMYVPKLSGEKSIENGTPSYQHPKRTEKDFNEKIDHFSILNIYTSLISLSISTELYDKFNDGDNIIFTKEDFLKPDDSELFKVLFQIKEVKRLVFCIKQSLLSNSIYIDNIKDILNNVFPKPSIVISHTPDIPLAGNDITISWITENSDSVKINGKDYAVSGKITEKYNASKKISFEIANPFDKSTVSYEIKVLNSPVINNLKLRQQKIEFQKSTFLDWDVNYVTKVFLYSDGSKEDVSDKRSIEITPLKDTTYELSIIGLDGKTIISQKVNVQVFKRVLITEFKSNLDFVVESIPIKLTWKTENASKIFLSSPLEADIDVTGKNSIELKPKKDAIYTLTAKNELFQVSEQIGIGVQNLHKIPALDLAMPKMPTINITIPNISNDIFNENEKVFNNFLNKKEKFSLTKSLKSLLSK
jgi:hypothetical protein